MSQLEEKEELQGEDRTSTEEFLSLHGSSLTPQTESYSSSSSSSIPAWKNIKKNIPSSFSQRNSGNFHSIPAQKFQAMIEEDIRRQLPIAKPSPFGFPWWGKAIVVLLAIYGTYSGGKDIFNMMASFFSKKENKE